MKRLARTILTSLATVMVVAVVAAAQPVQGMTLGIQAEPNHGGGMLVTKVFADYPADDMGLAPGDVIVTVDGDVVNTHAQMRRAVDNIRDHVTLVVKKRNNGYEEVSADIVYGSPGTERPHAVKVKSKTVPRP